MADLRGKVVWITGASSGIGAAAAGVLVKAGARVVLTARRETRLRSVAAPLGQAAAIVAADLAQPEARVRAHDAAMAAFGRVDVLVNNAGIGRLGWLEELDDDRVGDQLALNLEATIHLSRLVLPAMLERRAGQIVTVASIAGLIAPPTYSIYSATKFAVRGFSEALRREVGPRGVSVSLVSPGAVRDTEWAEGAGIARRTALTTPAWLSLSAAQVADAILSVIRRPRPEIVMPWPLAAAATLNGVAPGLVDWGIAQAFTRRERG